MRTAAINSLCLQPQRKELPLEEAGCNPEENFKQLGTLNLTNCTNTKEIKVIFRTFFSTVRQMLETLIKFTYIFFV